ncbi:MAG: hypothetical protein HYS21_03780 [Deltaproteobacteria bacterium]|nr:hypothetical protein [Deltaproteobacteria bacterium]
MGSPLPVLLSFLAGAAGSAIIYGAGRAIGLMDMPAERSSHTVPTPRGAGAGIVAAVVTAAYFSGDITFALILAGVGLFGFFEDIIGLPVALRLIIYLVLSSLLAVSVLGLPDSAVSVIIFLFWVLFVAGTANIYNFMDGINGMAGLTGIVGFGLISIFAYISGSGLFVLGIVTMLACMGFLPFNFPKGRVFMGDVGSIFLGFLFASFVLKLSNGVEAFLSMSAFLGTFYADAIITILCRAGRGENIFMAHRNHLYQYLSNDLGIPHWKVSLGYASVLALLGILSLFSYTRRIVPQLAVSCLFIILSAVTYRSIKRIPNGGMNASKQL